MPLIGFDLQQTQPQSVQVISYQGDATINDVSSPPGNADVTFNIMGTGLIDALRGALPDQLGVASYVQNPAANFDSANYDFRLDITSGAQSGAGRSADGVWIPGGGVGIQASWGVSETGTGVSSVGGNFRVRPSGGGADLITQSVLLIAEVS